LLARAGFVPGDEQNCVAPGIEGKGHTPLAASKRNSFILP
jgi:hypothetical protein